MKKIVEARIVGMPTKFTDPLPRVMVKFEGEEEEVFLFDYMPDEIHISPEELIGLNKGQAFELRYKKDSLYLRS